LLADRAARLNTDAHHVFENIGVNTFKKLEYDGTDSPRLRQQMEDINEQMIKFD